MNGGEQERRGIPLVQSPRGPQTAAAAQKGVAANGHGGVVGGGAGGGLGGGLDGAHEVAADHDVGLDDGLAAQDDVLRAHQRRLARHLVARVRLYVLATRRPPGRHVDAVGADGLGWWRAGGAVVSDVSSSRSRSWSWSCLTWVDPWRWGNALGGQAFRAVWGPNNPLWGWTRAPVNPARPLFLGAPSR